MSNSVRLTIVFFAIIICSCKPKANIEKDYLEIVAVHEATMKVNATKLDFELVSVDTVSATRACSFLTTQILNRAGNYLKITGPSDLVDSLINKEPKRFTDCVLNDSHYYVIVYKEKLNEATWFQVTDGKDSLIYYSELRE